MSRLVSALVLCSIMLAWAGEANAQGAPAPAAPPPLPPPGLPPPTPPPPPPPIVRRPVELVPQIGIALPSCTSGGTSNYVCDGIEGGPTFGFAAFWRVSPHFAWGGGFDIAGFRYDPPSASGLDDTQAGAAWLGLLGRFYFSDEGSLDPYFQLGLGGAALGTSGTDEATGITYEDTGAGPAIQVGGGLDFILGRRLKVGPAIAYTRVFVDKIRRCRAGADGECQDVSKEDFGHLNGFLAITGRLTIMIGDEL